MFVHLQFVHLIRSVSSNSWSFLIFWMRFTSSLALPSRSSSGVTVTSRATVRGPFEATIQPGRSSLLISTSSSMISTDSLSNRNQRLPFFFQFADILLCEFSQSNADCLHFCAQFLAKQHKIRLDLFLNKLIIS